MIISKTPLRISFVGGGSDIKNYYVGKTGAVVSTAINKYIYITVNKKFDKKIRASYSKTEIVDSLDELQHELIRECLRMVGIKGGIEITSISDIPSEGTGLGSSSSYVVGLLNALYAYKGQYVNSETLAREACQIEIEILKKPIGKQDQYIAAYGGIQYMQFNPDGTVYIDPIICFPKTREKLEKHLLLVYTGITRSAEKILSEQNRAIKQDTKIRVMAQMVELALRMREDLRRNRLNAIGELLHSNWVLKQQMAKGITNKTIDALYSKARRSGAKGGKILGAGGGGFLLLWADKKCHKDIISAFSPLKVLPVEFEPQGSKIIFVQN